MNLNSLSRSVTIRPIIIVIAIVRMIPPMITVRMIVVISMVVIPMAVVSMGILAINPDRYACAGVSRFHHASSSK